MLCVLCAVAAIYVFSTRQKPSAQIPVSPPPPPPAAANHTVIGSSVEGRDIEEFTFGTGTTTILFVGGIDGGYEWNSAALAYQMTDYLTAHQETVPASEKVVIIPDANPDAIYKAFGITGHFVTADFAGRDLSPFRVNADGVDLNRNFDCNWAPKAKWQEKPENAGTAAFSEPETRAIRDAVKQLSPVAVVFWHSQAGGVFASQCNDGILPKTIESMNVYAEASGYKPQKVFDAYPVTGAGEDWLASQNIPALTVELSTHDSTDWDKNLAGTKALLNSFANDTTIRQ